MFNILRTNFWKIYLLSLRIKMVWTRPNGPLNVWDSVDVVNSDGKKVKFTIQEIPKDRYNEAVDNMYTIFATDEILCKSLDVLNAAIYKAMAYGIWSKVLAKGISVAAFMESAEDEIPFMAGINLLSVIDKDHDNNIKPMLSSLNQAEKILCYFHNCNVKVNPCELYGVDCYLGSYGLSLHPDYRRLGLGTRLLDIRQKIGRFYSVPVTSSLFLSSNSQSIATKAKFEIYYEAPYDEIIDEKGQLAFPDLKGKIYKIMNKRLF